MWSLLKIGIQDFESRQEDRDYRENAYTAENGRLEGWHEPHIDC